MGAMASQITSLSTVYSTFYSGADQRNHQSSASLAFVRGIHRGPVNSPHKWPVTRKMFAFDDVIMHNRVHKVSQYDMPPGAWPSLHPQKKMGCNYPSMPWPNACFPQAPLRGDLITWSGTRLLDRWHNVKYNRWRVYIYKMALWFCRAVLHTISIDEEKYSWKLQCGHREISIDEENYSWKLQCGHREIAKEKLNYYNRPLVLALALWRLKSPAIHDNEINKAPLYWSFVMGSMAQYALH